MLRKTVLSLKSPTGAFIAPLRCANVNLSGRGPSILLRKTVLSLIAIQLFNATATTLNYISQICWLNVALISCLAIKAPLGLSLLRFASQTRTFENTPLSAACKKTQGKLWQKERGPDGASPLDRIMRCSKISAAFIAVFKNSAEQNGIFTICSLQILLRWENRIRQKDKVSAGKIRTRQ